jgi:hypothetical protein
MNRTIQANSDLFGDGIHIRFDRANYESRYSSDTCYGVGDFVIYDFKVAQIMEIVKSSKSGKRIVELAQGSEGIYADDLTPYIVPLTMTNLNFANTFMGEYQRLITILERSERRFSRTNIREFFHKNYMDYVDPAASDDRKKYILKNMAKFMGLTDEAISDPGRKTVLGVEVFLNGTHRMERTNFNECNFNELKDHTKRGNSDAAKS